MSPSPKPPARNPAPGRTRLDEISYAFWAVVVAGLAVLSLMDACDPAPKPSPASNAPRSLCES